jgi:septum formation protein
MTRPGGVSPRSHSIQWASSLAGSGGGVSIPGRLPAPMPPRGPPTGVPAVASRHGRGTLDRVSTRRLVLASASPARRALLSAAGLLPEVTVSGVGEDGVDGLDAVKTTATLSLRKAATVADRLRNEAGPPTSGPTAARGPVVVGCDSVLAFGDEVRGKPDSPGQAASWWRTYRDRTGTLVTGHTVIDVDAERQVTATSQTDVRFGRPTDDEIAAYVATGEPLGVAGGFTLDGYGAAFVDGISGDPGTVLGLSVPLLRRLLAGLDIAITDLWAAR